MRIVPINMCAKFYLEIMNVFLVKIRSMFCDDVDDTDDTDDADDTDDDDDDTKGITIPRYCFSTELKMV